MTLQSVQRFSDWSILHLPLRSIFHQTNSNICTAGLRNPASLRGSGDFQVKRRITNSD